MEMPPSESHTPNLPQQQEWQIRNAPPTSPPPLRNRPGVKKKIALPIPALYGALVVAGLIVGLAAGYWLGSQTRRQSRCDSSLLSYDSQAVVQRTIVAKGEIRDLLDNSIVIVPLNLSTPEQELEKLTIPVDKDTTIILQIRAADDTQSATPQKVTKADLRAGDRLDVIMSVSNDGSIKTSTISAIREQ